MTGKGSFTFIPNRRLRFMVASHLVWLATVCALGAWWAKLLMRQATRIDELERAAGLDQSLAHHQWQSTQRMFKGGQTPMRVLNISGCLKPRL